MNENEQTKPWWDSKTLWFNIFMVALEGVELQFSLIQPYVPGNVYAWGLLITTVGNKILRVISAARLTLK